MVVESIRRMLGRRLTWVRKQPRKDSLIRAKCWHGSLIRLLIQPANGYSASTVFQTLETQQRDKLSAFLEWGELLQTGLRFQGTQFLLDPTKEGLLIAEETLEGSRKWYWSSLCLPQVPILRPDSNSRIPPADVLSCLVQDQTWSGKNNWPSREAVSKLWPMGQPQPIARF